MPGFAVDTERLQAALAQVRARLGDTATDTATDTVLAEGEALSLPASLAAPSGRSPCGPRGPFPRESRPRRCQGTEVLPAGQELRCRRRNTSD
jgi:hypothetical protein